MPNCRGVFRNQSNICDAALLQKQLTANSRVLFSQKSSIIDGRLCPKYAYELYFKFKKTPLTKCTNACIAKSSFFSRFKVFKTVSPISLKPVKLPILNKNQIFFTFILSNKRVTNQPAPLYPHVVFIKYLRVRSLANCKILVLRRCS